jgi:hypothetical protein
MCCIPSCTGCISCVGFISSIRCIKPLSWETTTQVQPLVLEELYKKFKIIIKAIFNIGNIEQRIFKRFSREDGQNVIFIECYQMWITTALVFHSMGYHLASIATGQTLPGIALLWATFYKDDLSPFFQ